MRSPRATKISIVAAIRIARTISTEKTWKEKLPCAISAGSNLFLAGTHSFYQNHAAQLAVRQRKGNNSLTLKLSWRRFCATKFLALFKTIWKHEKLNRYSNWQWMIWRLKMAKANGDPFDDDSEAWRYRMREAEEYRLRVRKRLLWKVVFLTVICWSLFEMVMRCLSK